MIFAFFLITKKMKDRFNYYNILFFFFLEKNGQRNKFEHRFWRKISTTILAFWLQKNILR